MTYLLKDDFASTDDDDNAFWTGTGKDYISHSFTPAASFVLTQIEVKLQKISSPVGTITCYIYGDTSTHPGSSLGEATNTLDESTISASPTYYAFQFSGVSLTGSTRYWVVLKTTSDGSVGQVAFDCDSSGQTGYLLFSSDATTWNDLNSYGNTVQGTIKTYETEAVASSIEQEGFRFRNDDGSESAATWKDSQDTNVNSAPGDIVRLRTIINSKGDVASKQFQLEFKKSTDSVWNKVN
jgi:hypothetical protein